MNLRTTDAEYAAIWQAYNAAREGTTAIKVDKQALHNLLDDYGAMVARLEKVIPLSKG